MFVCCWYITGKMQPRHVSEEEPVVLNINAFVFQLFEMKLRFTDISERPNVFEDSISTLMSSRTTVFAQRRSTPLERVAKEFEKGVKVGPNTWRLKTYEDTFVGEDAVTFLVKHKYARSRLQAVELGRKLQARFDLFRHVSREHAFSDDRLFFVFVPKIERRASISNFELDFSVQMEDIDSPMVLQRVADTFRNGVAVKTHTYHFRRYPR